MSQITTATFFRVEGVANKWWAFKQMQIGIKSVEGTPGLTFFKILGSGGKNGFSIVPNFGVYVLLCVWDSEACARSFMSTNEFFETYSERSLERFTIFAHAAQFHGYWDGKQPFLSTVQLKSDKPVLVLTRARIYLKKLWSFWRRVRNVSKSLDDYNGVALSIGIGEWPLIQQATISIWKTQAEMMDYAYKNETHKRVVVQSKQLKWYKEEMFARFVPYKYEGTWLGEGVKI